MTDAGFEDNLDRMRVWRMGPRRDRRERWDLMPVSDIGLDPGDSGALFSAGFYTAGRLAAALAKKRRPALRDARLRAAATEAVRAVIELTRADREAIERDVAELRRHHEEKREGRAAS